MNECLEKSIKVQYLYDKNVYIERSRLIEPLKNWMHFGSGFWIFRMCGFGYPLFKAKHVFFPDPMFRCCLPPGHVIGTPFPLIKEIKAEEIQNLKKRFSGRQQNSSSQVWIILNFIPPQDISNQQKKIRVNCNNCRKMQLNMVNVPATRREWPNHMPDTAE